MIFNELEIVARIVHNNGNVPRTHATEAGQLDTSYLVNNPLSSLFSECTMSLNGEKFQQLVPILPISVSLRQNFLKVMMQRKYGLLVKASLMKIIHQVLMVLMGELKMSLNVSES